MKMGLSWGWYRESANEDRSAEPHKMGVGQQLKVLMSICPFYRENEKKWKFELQSLSNHIEFILYSKFHLFVFSYLLFISVLKSIGRRLVQFTATAADTEILIE